MADHELDANILAVLPQDSRILSIAPSGRSFWVKTLRIEIELPNGDVQVIFKKGSTGEAGHNMMLGTFESEKAFHSFVPEYVPRPIAWGPESAQPDSYFYICDFVDMDDELPSPAGWAKAVATLHQRSMGKSPTGMFGFPVNTHLAKFPVDNTWNPSWEAFWAQQMRSMFKQEYEQHGFNEELEELKKALYEEAIPRFLRPLETGGRSIQPCLVHSDLWPGNIKPRPDADEVCMFDSCGYWGHNEADLSICYNPRYRLGLPWVAEYQKHISVSEPAEDFDDRKMLYALKFHVLLSIMYKDLSFRQIVIDELKKIVEKARGTTLPGLSGRKVASISKQIAMPPPIASL